MVLEVCAWVLGAGSEQGYRMTQAASRQAEGFGAPLAVRSPFLFQVPGGGGGLAGSVACGLR